MSTRECTMKMVLAYITARDTEEAKSIGERLVAKRLAGCVNILGGMRSLYWWEGKIESAKEAVLIAQTRESLVTKLMVEVKEIHSMSCPCMLILPIQGGHSAYLRRLAENTTSK